MTTEISFFSFSGRKNKWYAFQQMGLAKRQLEKVRGLRFFKLMGSGGGSGFSIRPDFSTYSLLTVWATDRDRECFFSDNEWFREYLSRAGKWANLSLQCIHSRGLWNSHNPFREQQGELSGDKVVVLTRASIKAASIPAFWKHVPKVSRILEKEENVLFAKGIGEWPLIELTTVSIWNNERSMEHFAYSPGSQHSDALKAAKQKGWFKEDLFARFSIRATGGDWDLLV